MLSPCLRSLIYTFDSSVSWAVSPRCEVDGSNPSSSPCRFHLPVPAPPSEPLLLLLPPLNIFLPLNPPERLRHTIANTTSTATPTSTAITIPAIAPPLSLEEEDDEVEVDT